MSTLRAIGQHEHACAAPACSCSALAPPPSVNPTLSIHPTPTVRTKLLLLAAPFLKRWNYARHAEQISGGHKYLPPRQDVNAPGEGRRRVGFVGM